MGFSCGSKKSHGIPWDLVVEAKKFHGIPQDLVVEEKQSHRIPRDLVVEAKMLKPSLRISDEIEISYQAVLEKYLKHKNL